ncbi:MAG: type II secretion system F family protein [Candidatus Falkowbacteria bacterium]|nr:type II secretion system F family protein [Candidatus Falkowbacteria bacterium]
MENLSMLVFSGMPVSDSLSSIAEEVHSSRMKKIIGDIRIDIENGSPVWKALEASNLLKPHSISLIRLGEKAGKLTENLRVVATEEQKDRNFKSKLRSAMMYPIFVMSITAVVGIGIAWFILPKLAEVFFQLNIKLPLITKILIGLGAFLGKYGQYAIPGLIIFLFLAYYSIFVYRKTKIVGQFILFHTPGVKQLMKEVEVARFGYLLGTLLEAGVPIIVALDSLANATEFLSYRNFYLHIRNSVSEGNSLQKSFASFGRAKKLVPVPILQLVVAGEKSGNLSNVLLKVGLMFEDKADATTKNLTIILEPILLVVVWLGVVAVALAVILPIYGLVGGLSTT